MVDRRNPSADLAAVGQITSLDNSSSLVLEGAGNLDPYRSTGAARWATSNERRGQCTNAREDGNLVLYAPGEQWRC
jgi:hypothetical protein